MRRAGPVVFARPPSPPARPWGSSRGAPGPTRTESRITANPVPAPAPATFPRSARPDRISEIVG